jgi:adenylate cyclase
MERRLAAIFAADMVGYSRLMAVDEAGTLARQKAHHTELIRPKIGEYGGRVIKTTGDGLLVEFPSVVDALRCAVTIQLAMPEREAAQPAESRIAYRIGINLGDIIAEDDDIYGDGVNVSARLEALAEPGGISVSRTVVNHVRGKVASGFEDLGEQEVKNLPEPVHVFRVLMKPEEAGEAVVAIGSAKWWKRPVAALAIAGIVLVIAAAGIMVWQPWAPDVEPASVGNMAFPLPERPSIAVLPFDNLSGDAEHEYCADGITEDIITELSRFRELFVIARNSTFAYKGKPVKVQQVAEDLGVRYVLEGSVRRSTDRLRITAQLVDVLSGRHIWAENYDREPTDILALQDDITRNIVTTMAVKVDEAELERVKRKTPASLDAYDHVLRADRIFDRFGKEDNLRARALYEKAIEHDPEYARAYTGLAGTHERDFVFGWSESPSHSLQLALQSAQKAITLDPSDHRAHHELGWVYIFQKRHHEGMAELEKAIAFNPNDADVLAYLGLALIYVGNPGEALEMVKTAMRLSPFHPDWYWDQLAFAYYYNRQYEEAIKAAKRVPQPWAGIYRELAASYAQLDRMEEAQAAAAKVLKLEPGFSTETFRRTMPFKNPADVDHYLDGLRKAGLPD